MSLAVDRLYRGEIVTVTDVCCRAHDAYRGPEEAASGDEIVFPRRGCFVRHHGRRQTAADANSVLFFRRHESYRVSHPVGGGDDCTSLIFSKAVLTEAFAAYDPSALAGPGAPFSADRALATADVIVLMQQLRRALLSPRRLHSIADALRIDESAMQLLDAVARSAASSRRQPSGGARDGTIRAHRDLVESVRVLLCERMGGPLTLPEIARAVHSSPFHLARIFRRMTGLSLHQYRTNLRLRTALEHLTGGATDLTSLALALGFASHSHFSASFRRAFGLAPRAFRRDPRIRRVREMSTNLKVSFRPGA